MLRTTSDHLALTGARQDALLDGIGEAINRRERAEVSATTGLWLGTRF
jgi:hypothetical protein